MQLVYGVLRHRQYLDRILEILSRTPLPKLDPFVRQALAIGLYQLFFLERIPDSAAVNEAVKCCKAAKIPQRLHGFVNGILRQAVRQKAVLCTEAHIDSTGQTIVNHPDWLVQRWRQNFGCAETDRICRANNVEPALVLRVNVPVVTRDGFCQSLEKLEIPCRRGVYAEEAVILPGFHGSISTIPGYAEGFFQVQDEAAQLATRLLGPFRCGGVYLDGCAGLGGKTSHLFQLAQQHRMHIHAVEPEPHRLKKLRENLGRLYSGDEPVIHDGNLQQFSTLHTDLLFDGILIDAPCSGTGVTGRHPDIRWNRRPEEIARYHREQLDLLRLAARHVRPLGLLVYATCSLEPEENQDVIHEFLQNHDEFVLTECTPHLPKPAHRFVENNFFCPRPDETIDGFFAARMQRT